MRCASISSAPAPSRTAVAVHWLRRMHVWVGLWGALLGLLFARPRDRGRDPGFATLALFGLLLLVYGVIFSAAGGIFHLYYLSALMPPVAALAGIGAWQAWRRGPAYLAIGLVLCAAWQVWVTGMTLGWTATWLGFPVGVAMLFVVAGAFSIPSITAALVAVAFIYGIDSGAVPALRNAATVLVAIGLVMATWNGIAWLRRREKVRKL